MNRISNYDGQPSQPGYPSIIPDNVIGLQGAALIHELRKLQETLDQIREAKLGEFSVSAKPILRHRQARDRPGEQRIRGTVGRCLGLLGLHRSSSVDRSRGQRLRDEAIIRPLRTVSPSVGRTFRPAPERYPERTARPIAAKVIRAHAREWYARPSAPEQPRNEAPKRNETSLAPSSQAERKRKSKLWALVASGLHRLSAGCAFLVERLRSADLDEASGAEFTTGLKWTYENELKVGLRVLIAGLLVFGGWATVVPLSSAIVVPGTLVVKSSVKRIQHETGGIVAQIPVHDGMHVQAGDVVLRLDETQRRAEFKVLIQQLNQVRVGLARLVAERDGLSEPKMPSTIAAQLIDPEVKLLWASEISLFNSRTAALRSAKGLLRSRVGQLQEEISGLEAQVKSKDAQREFISGELAGVETLYQKGLVPVTRKTSLQREAARLDGDRGQALAAIAEVKSKISEAKLQIVRVDQDFRTEVMKNLREAQDKEAELIEKTSAVQDLLKRLDLRAPISGIIQQLSAHTIGGVIAPREVVMEIVPESPDLLIEARLPPQDIDQVRIGQKTYIRFTSFNQRTTPQLGGVVSYVSPDLSRDQRTDAGYYTVRVTLSGDQRRRLGSLQLVSGMPAEVFMQTGTRTMSSYLLKPISDQLGRIFVER
jgi:HlyD family secretion protein